MPLSPQTTPLSTPQSQQKPNWLVWLFVGAATILIVSAVIRLLTPPEKPVEVSPSPLVNSDGSTTRVLSVTFTGSTPVIPPKLQTGDVISLEGLPKQILDALIQKYSLQPASVPNVWQNGETYLIKQSDKDVFTLSLPVTRSSAGLVNPSTTSANQSLSTTSTTQPTTAAPTTAEMIQSGSQFLRELSSDLAFTAVENKITTFVSDENMEKNNVGSGQNTQTQEDTYTVSPYTITIDSYPLYVEQQNTFPIELTFDPNGQLIKLQLYPQLVKLGTLRALTPLSLNQALNQIRSSAAERATNGSTKGSATSTVIVINAAKTQFGPLQLETLSNVELKELSIEYRVDAQTNQILPYYRFTGTALNTGGEKITVEMITPAVPTVTQLPQ